MVQEIEMLNRYDANENGIYLDEALYALTGGEPEHLRGLTAQEVRDLFRDCGEELEWSDSAIEQHLEGDDVRRAWTAETIKRLRQRRGLTQEQLAREVGTTVVSVSRWEHGHTKPTRLAERALSRLEMANHGPASDR